MTQKTASLPSWAYSPRVNAAIGLSKDGGELKTLV